jgi:methionyl-tRNA synthetase
MLEAAGYRLPTAVHVHGFLTVDGRKMSKSRGTFITARQFADFLNPWCLRYYYGTKLNDSVDDLDLNVEEFAHRINAELVNNITNLVSRAVGFLNKRLESQLGAVPEDARELMPEIEEAVQRCRGHFLDFRFGQASREILLISDIANNYIQQQEPWSAIKSDPERARNILTFAANCVKIIAVLLKPILPGYCKKVEEILDVGDLRWNNIAFDLENRKIGQFQKLLDRLEPGVFEKLVETTRESIAGADLRPLPEVPDFGSEITIEDFASVDLRVGRIAAAAEMEGSDKLLRLDVDLGREVRTVFAGIKKYYSPEALVGRSVIVVANLKPRKMKFGLSQGMVLAAVDNDGRVVLCDVDPSIPPGTPIR